MLLKYLLPLFYIGQINQYVTIKPAWPEKCLKLEINILHPFSSSECIVVVLAALAFVEWCWQNKEKIYFCINHTRGGDGL
jgi:hypothetical protein